MEAEPTPLDRHLIEGDAPRLARDRGPQASPEETIDVGRIMARALATSAEDNERLALARSFGSRLVAAWWRALVKDERIGVSPRAQLGPFETTYLPPSAEALADSLGEAAAQIGAETAAYHIGLIYTSMLPRAHRAKLGIYYTPPSLTERLIVQATATGVDWSTCHVLDPACGGGAFLAPVARRILDELPDCTPQILVKNIASRLRGYEIDPFCRSARKSDPLSGEIGIQI